MASEAATTGEVLEIALSPFGTGAASELLKQMERLVQQLPALLLNVVAASPAERAAAPAKSESKREASMPPTLDGAGTGFPLTPAILGIGFGIGQGIGWLSGGGEQRELPSLVEFRLPAPIRVNAGVSERVTQGPFPIDYAQGGSSRPVAMGPQTHVTVQVQAMDSRSFLDHSGDIARAVRQAMLESSVLNDVIREV